MVRERLVIFPYTPNEFAVSGTFVKPAPRTRGTVLPRRVFAWLYKGDVQNTSVCKVTYTHVSPLQYFANLHRRVRKTVTCINFLATRV